MAVFAMLTGVLVIAFPVSVFSDLWSKELKRAGALDHLGSSDEEDAVGGDDVPKTVSKVPPESLAAVPHSHHLHTNPNINPNPNHGKDQLHHLIPAHSASFNPLPRGREGGEVARMVEAVGEPGIKKRRRRKKMLSEDDAAAIYKCVKQIDESQKEIWTILERVGYHHSSSSHDEP